MKAFRLRNADLVLRKVNVDERGGRHYRYDQVADGLPVVGGDLVVHADASGAITGIHGTARGGVPTAAILSISERAASDAIASDPRFEGLRVTGSRVVFVQADDGALHKAYEQVVEGVRGQDPVRDKVFVDVETGRIVAVHPTIHFARNRLIHDANHGTTVPGALARIEGQIPTGDGQVDVAYDHMGAFYDAHLAFFSRDSYNGAGAALQAAVHYSTNSCSIFWNGTYLVSGDGDPAQGCAPPVSSLDVVAHELSHGVTASESNLIYSGESGALNESYSDIFGAFVEAYADGGSTGTLAIDSGTFLIGDEYLPPFLRNMCDPAADGVSRDLWNPGVGSADIHHGSGINNLAFCLLTNGGVHPRGKTTVNVPAIGMEQAVRIFYKAYVDYLTSSSSYTTMRSAAIAAAQQLGYDAATQEAVACAYAAVAVGSAPASCAGPPLPPPPSYGVLTSGVPVTGLSDNTIGNFRYWKIDVPAFLTGLVLNFSISGGTGDADLYIQHGSAPTSDSFLCRPNQAGNNESCLFTHSEGGTYWVGLRTYAPYAGVTLIAQYPGGLLLQNGIPVKNLSGAQGSELFLSTSFVPAGRTLTIRTSGGTGDVDLYTRFNATPTQTSYACRPYQAGNNETCTHTTTAGGPWQVMLRGYTAYSGLQIVATW